MRYLPKRIGLAAAWLLAALIFASSALGQGPLRLDQANFVMDASARPPSDKANWIPLKLPDAWPLSHLNAMQNGPSTGWYRLSFRYPAHPTTLHAIYLPKHGLNAAAFLNGHELGNGGAFHEPVGRNWNRPLLWPIPHNILRPGENILHIRLLSHPYTQANLDPVWVGDESILRAQFERNQFWRITLNQTATLLIAAMGGLMLVLWWQRRQETAYGYFGLSALIWAAQSTNLYLQTVPFSTATWEIIVNSSFQVFAAFLLISLLRFSAAGGQKLIPLLWFSAIASPLTQAITPAPYFLAATSFWHVFTLLSTALTFAVLVRAALRWKNRDAMLLSAALGLVVILATHDWIMHSQHFWRDDPNQFLEDIHLLHFSAPLIFLVVGLIMTSRFVRVLNDFEALNSNLESRVQMKHAELQESYQLTRALETQRAITEERDRIYRDLHDDVGAKLLSLVYRANTPENAQLARSALQELRDVVSTTHPENLSLEALNADWRTECEQRLSDAGIALNWKTHGEFSAVYLTQPQALNLSRILREAISNLIKHAQAETVRIQIRLDANAVEMLIEDDGIGFASPTPGNGSGLRNMQARADRIQAEISIAAAGESGCRIAVRLPLPPQQPT